MTEEQLMKENENKLKEAYARANTKSKKKRIVRDLITFSSVCYEYFGIEKDYDWDFDWNLLELIKDYELPFIQNVMESTPLFKSIFKTVLDSFIDVKFPFYKDYYKDYRRLTDLELQEIIFSFLNSYDPKLQKDFKNMLNNGNVFEADLCGCGGFTHSIETLNKNLMFYSREEGNSVDTASIIAHEYGHCYEIKNYYDTGAKNYMDKIYTTPYYEISSKFFEYAFLNYLKENNIFIEDTNMRLNIYYIDLLINAFNINLLHQMNKININEVGNVTIEGYNIIKMSKEIQEKLNYYDIPSEEGDAFNYRDAHIYGIGSIFSIYLYENYREDPNNFKKEFRNALLTYPYTNNVSVFERVGIVPETLIKGDTLKKILRNSR